MRIGALEAGGTKMVLAVADENGNIYERTQLPTGAADETLVQVAAWFKEREVEALGIGCFGPLDLDPASPSYGHITTTPKAAWRHCDIVGQLGRALAGADAAAFPIGFDTDVNASCLGEATWGSTRDVDASIYITVGTGIGVGAMIAGQMLHGLSHPEAGHILIGRATGDDFAGVCPYHHGTTFCLEGMAAGPAIEARWGQKAEALYERYEVWELEAHYLAAALVNYILCLSPKRIVLGGGVMKQELLFPLVREKTALLLGGYLPLPDLEGYIVPPALGDDQGILGCVKLALLAAKAQPVI